MMIIFNALFLAFIRIPEIFAMVYYVIFYRGLTEQFTVYFNSNINEIFDFMFVFHPLCQFYLFYKFNRNFNESFLNLYMVLKVK